MPNDALSVIERSAAVPLRLPFVSLLRSCSVVFLFTSIGLLTHSVRAANLQVSPTLVELLPEERAEALWLRNTGDSPIRAQVRLLAWSQANGSEQLTATHELIASPPFVEIPANGEQLVRIVRSVATAGADEMAYRVLIDELPQPQADATAPPSQLRGLQFLLRYSVPVFVEPVVTVGSVSQSRKEDALSDLSNLKVAVSYSPKAPHAAILKIENAGVRRAKISQLYYVDASGKRTIIVGGLLGYVLGRKSMYWPVRELPDSIAAGKGTFEAKFNNDLEAQTLPAVIAPD